MATVATMAVAHPLVPSLRFSCQPWSPSKSTSLAGAWLNFWCKSKLSILPPWECGRADYVGGIRLYSGQQSRQVVVKGVARRMLYEDTDYFVLLEPGQDEVFVNLEELQIRLRYWLENWPSEKLPSDLARFGETADAVDYLTESACELDLGGGLGSVQWFQVRMESKT